MLSHYGSTVTITIAVSVVITEIPQLHLCFDQLELEMDMRSFNCVSWQKCLLFPRSLCSSDVEA